MIIISDTWWDIYISKYHKLMHTIAKQISGDILASIEDNYAELCIAAMDSVRGFAALIDNYDVDSFLNNDQFDKYTKTVLWHRKSNIGTPITRRNKKFKILSDTDVSCLPNENDESSSFLLTEIDVKPQGYFNVFDDCRVFLDTKEYSLLCAISDGYCISPSGTIDISKVSKHFGLTTYEGSKFVEKFRAKMRKYANAE